MARQTKKPATPKTVEALKHEEARRKNIPTAEYQSVMARDEQSAIRLSPRFWTGEKLNP